MPASSSSRSWAFHRSSSGGMRHRTQAASQRRPGRALRPHRGDARGADRGAGPDGRHCGPGPGTRPARRGLGLALVARRPRRGSVARVSLARPGRDPGREPDAEHRAAGGAGGERAHPTGDGVRWTPSTSDPRFSYWFPGRVSVGYITQCAELEGFSAFILLTSDESRAQLEAEGGSGEPGWWADCARSRDSGRSPTGENGFAGYPDRGLDPAGGVRR